MHALLRTTAPALLVLALANCSTGGTDCDGKAVRATQTGTEFDVAGTFLGGQPVLTLTQGNFVRVIASTEYTSTGATFDITGIPPGVYSATWEMSCNNGGGTKRFSSSSVPTMTIQ